jgi:hypothetical protein
LRKEATHFTPVKETDEGNATSVGFEIEATGEGGGRRKFLF